MCQPSGFEVPGQESWVWKLTWSLYSMKQAGCIWNQTMNAKITKWGFAHLSSKSCIYYQHTSMGVIITAIHVDDFLSIASSKEENDCIKEQMQQAWTISDLGEVCFVVGLAIEWDCPNKTFVITVFSH
jgi:hypothetical protein